MNIEELLKIDPEKTKRLRDMVLDCISLEFDEEHSEEGFYYHLFRNNRYIGTYTKMPCFGDTVVISDKEGYIYINGQKSNQRIVF